MEFDAFADFAGPEAADGWLNQSLSADSHSTKTNLLARFLE